MNESEKLERFVGQVLKAQPLRKAPPTLERRVFAAIERRIAQPWWRQSLLHWPIPARVAFLLASFGIVKLALMGVMWLIADSQTAPVVTRSVSFYEHLASFVSTLSSLVSTLFHAIPPQWLAGALILTVLLYLALFALGATAYRTLYVNK